MSRLALTHSKFWIAVLLAGGTFAASVPAGAQADDRLLCDGKPPTIVGTSGDDRIEGAPGDDVIMALDGNDVVFGRGGSDTICGGAGRDRLIGGAGADVLSGDSGRDSLRGGPGADILTGGSATDRSSGGPGSDVLIDDVGNDLLRGGKGADLLDGGPGRDRCSGDAGYDAVGSGCESGRWEAGVRVVDVDGVSIRFVGETAEVPTSPSTIWISVLIADRKDGPTMCLGASTLTPNCPGPIIEGLTLEHPWAAEQFGERMGTRLVEVSWPPVDNRVQLVSERPAMRFASIFLPGLSSFSLDNFKRPEDCVGLDRRAAVGFDEFQAWGDAHPDEYGGIFTAGAGPGERGVPAMQVKASGARLEEIRAELTTDEASPCLVSVSFTETEITTAQQQLEALRIPGLLGHGITRDAVAADVVAIDRQTIDAIVAAVDRPDLIELTIQAILG